jgi:hypothetical protein
MLVTFDMTVPLIGLDGRSRTFATGFQSQYATVTLHLGSAESQPIVPLSLRVTLRSTLILKSLLEKAVYDCQLLKVTYSVLYSRVTAMSNTYRYTLSIYSKWKPISSLSLPPESLSRINLP